MAIGYHFWRQRSARTIELVYVLGIARRNHRPSPLRKPFPFALTRSLAIRPSRRATATLKTVLRTRKNECKTTIRVSLDLNEGNAMRKRIARSWRRKAVSILGFDFKDVGCSGKKGASDLSFESGVSRIGI